LLFLMIMFPLVGAVVGVSIRTGASSTSMRDGALAPPVIVSSLSMVRVSSPSRQRPSSSISSTDSARLFFSSRLCALAHLRTSRHRLVHVHAQRRTYIHTLTSRRDILSAAFEWLGRPLDLASLGFDRAKQYRFYLRAEAYVQ
jgi:hypothetical protein